MQKIDSDGYVAQLSPLFKRRRQIRLSIVLLLPVLLVGVSQQSSNIFTIIGLASLVGLILLLIKLFFITYSLEETVWDRFRSKMTKVVNTSSSIETPVLAGVMGSIGDAQSLFVIAAGTLENYEVRLLKQSVYYNPQSKNGHYSREFRILEIKTTEDFYHVFMVSRQASRNILSTAMTVLAKSVKHNKKLVVEGDVNKYFNIYIPEAAESESLITLSPENLLAIRDYGHNFDIEFIGKSIYIISNNKMRNLKSILIYQDSALEVIRSLGVNLVRNRPDTDDLISVVNPDVMTF